MINKLSLTTSIALVFGFASAGFSQTPVDDQQAQAELQQRIHRLPSEGLKNTQRVKLQDLLKFIAQEEQTPAACQESSKTVIDDRYVLTRSASGSLCRLYDLTFPTLLGGQKTSQIPVERFAARDYLQWIKGDYESVYKKQEQMKSGFQAAVVLSQSWLKDLKFKNDSRGGQQAIKAQFAGQLPEQFYASDLELGAPFRLSTQEHAQYASLLSLVSKANSSETRWLVETLERPEKFLEKVKFQWNDLNKVYDIILEGGFFPLYGPVIAVDFDKPYRLVVQKMTRQILGSILRNLALSIPQPTARALIDVAVTDVFEFVDMMYSYQDAQLESILGIATQPQSRLQTGLDLATLARLENMFYGSRADFMAEYILSAVQGQNFDWSQIESLGPKAKYKSLKAKEIAIRQTYSRLAQKKDCEISLQWSYFGVCRQQGEQKAVYSLLSEHKFLFWNLGAPLVHRFERPSEVLLKRVTSWLLSAGVRVFGLQFSRVISDRLSYELKEFSTVGLVDEGYMRPHMRLSVSNPGTLSELQIANLQKWSYLQNINPFLPKTVEQELEVIKKNSAALKIQAQ